MDQSVRPACLVLLLSCPSPCRGGFRPASKSPPFPRRSAVGPFKSVAQGAGSWGGCSRAWKAAGELQVHHCQARGFPTHVYSPRAPQSLSRVIRATGTSPFLPCRLPSLLLLVLILHLPSLLRFLQVLFPSYLHLHVAAAPPHGHGNCGTSNRQERRLGLRTRRAGGSLPPPGSARPFAPVSRRSLLPPPGHAGGTGGECVRSGCTCPRVLGRFRPAHQWVQETRGCT